MSNLQQLPVFPMRRVSPLDPPPPMLALLADKPVSRVKLRNGGEAWLITRYDDVRAVMTSPAFSSDVAKPGYPKVSESLAKFTEGLLNHMDPPEHDEYRRMLAPEFMVKRMERLRPEVQNLVDGLVDDMMAQGPPADLIAGLGFPLPARVTCTLLGVPFEDEEFFVTCAETFLSSTSTAEEAGKAAQDLRSYLGDLIDAKAANPTDDVLSYMASEHVRRGAISRDALVTIATLLLIAGFDTTTNMIGLGMLTLIQHPDQLELLKAEPDRIPAATEELLRFLTITHWGRHKAAIDDVVIGGQLIRAGEGVIAAQDCANRDPDAFGRPNDLDVCREARNHLAFGHGVHMCIGAALARIELQVSYATLLRRMPNIALAIPFEELVFKQDNAVYGVSSLPVTW